MLILPPGHARSVRTRRSLSGREKRILVSVIGAVLVLVVVLVVSLAVSGHSSRSGCIYATIPAATGAQEINQCGAAARATCASSTVPGAFTAQASRVIIGECRKAGLPTNR